MTESSPAFAPARWLTPARLDRIEQVVILVLWFFLVRRVLASPNPLAPLVLVAETSVVVFTLIRRPTTAISVNWRDWMVAAIATFLPLLVEAGDEPWPWLVPIGVSLVLVGNIGQLMAKLFLRRSFGIAPANRGIKVEGPYRVVRHPMYAGYLIVHFGILMLLPSWFNLLCYGTSWSAQIVRLLAEERLLSKDPAYSAYMQKVRWRLLPGVF